MINSNKVLLSNTDTYNVAAAFTAEDYIWAAKSYPVSSAIVQGMYDNCVQTGRLPVGENWRRIDCRQAFIRVCQSQALRRAEEHPRFSIDAAVQTGTAVLTTETLSVVEDELEKVYPIQEGFIVKKAADVLPAIVSEAVAYSITTSTGLVGDNVVGVAALGMLADDYSIATSPQSVSKEAGVNAAYCYAMYQKKPAILLQHAVEITRKWTVVGVTSVTANANMFPHESKVEYAQGKMKVPTPTGAAQPATGYQDEKNFYAYLARHRAIRGEDKHQVSELTAGYYVCAMSRAMDKTLWRAIDILHMCHVMKANKLYYSTTHLKSYEQRILSANGIALHPVTSDLVLPVYPGRLYHSTYEGADAPNTLIYIKDYFGPSSPANEKKDASKEPILVKIREQIGRMMKNAFTHTFLRDMHSEYASRLVPSIHCHSGHVMLIGSDVAEPMDVKAQFQRMTVANKYKTAFGYRHRTFSTVDPFICVPLASGLKLPCVRGELDTHSDTTAAEMVEWLGPVVAAPKKKVAAFPAQYACPPLRAMIVCTLCRGEHMDSACPKSPHVQQLLAAAAAIPVAATIGEIELGEMMPMSSMDAMPVGFSKFQSLTPDPMAPAATTTTITCPQPEPSTPPQQQQNSGGGQRGRGKAKGRGGGRGGQDRGNVRPAGKHPDKK
jgi:hypothetical protein